MSKKIINHENPNIHSYLEDGNYYYVYIDAENEFPSLQQKVKPYLEKSDNQKSLKLLLDFSMESWSNSVNIIYENVIIPLNIDPASVVLLSGNRDIKKLVNFYCDTNNKKPIIGIWYPKCQFTVAEVCKAYYHNAPLKLYLKNKKIKKIKKHFLSFNRRWRPHRSALIGLLHSKNLLNQGYVSFTETDEQMNWIKAYDEIFSLSKTSIVMHDLWKNNEQRIKSLPNLIIDQPLLGKNPFDLDIKNTNKFYEETMFSVVTETNFYKHIESAVFPTEKIFKPMAFNHPFIVVSRPHTLDCLRELGYKTFHPYINEDYDLEADDNTRLLKIIDEIERLCNLNEEEILTFLDAVKSITMYNFKTLISKVK